MLFPCNYEALGLSGYHIDMLFILIGVIALKCEFHNKQTKIIAVEKVLIIGCVKRFNALIYHQQAVKTNLF